VICGNFQPEEDFQPIVRYREAVRAAQRGRELGPYGTATVLTGALSPGAVSRVEVSLRPGRYLVVSEYTPFAEDAVSDASIAGWSRPLACADPVSRRGDVRKHVAADGSARAARMASAGFR
jgi:hypothetical protein